MSDAARWLALATHFVAGLVVGGVLVLAWDALRERVRAVTTARVVMREMQRLHDTPPPPAPDR